MFTWPHKSRTLGLWPKMANGKRYVPVFRAIQGLRKAFFCYYHFGDTFYVITNYYYEPIVSHSWAKASPLRSRF